LSSLLSRAYYPALLTEKFFYLPLYYLQESDIITNIPYTTTQCPQK
jgi:hypothetical protein